MRIENAEADRWAREWPRHVEGFEIGPGGLIAIYDDPEMAERVAEAEGGIAKHSSLRGNPHFKTFSTVVLPAGW